MTKTEPERNYVADAYNWEQRIKGENESARIWASNWGELYAKDEPQLYGGKIDQLEKKMTQIPAERIITNSQMSYKFVQPYKEFGPNFKRRTFDKFDTLVGMEDEEENIEYKEEKKSGKRRRRGCL